MEVFIKNNYFSKVNQPMTSISENKGLFCQTKFLCSDDHPLNHVFNLMFEQNTLNYAMTVGYQFDFYAQPIKTDQLPLHFIWFLKFQDQDVLIAEVLNSLFQYELVMDPHNVVVFPEDFSLQLKQKIIILLLFHQYLSQSSSSVQKAIIKQQAMQLNDIESDNVLLNAFAKFYSSLILADDYQYIDSSLSNIMKSIETFQNHEFNLELDMDTFLYGNIFYPINMKRHILSQLYVQNSQIDIGFRILKEIPNLQVQALEMLVLLGRDKHDECNSIIDSELKSSIANHFEYQEDNLLSAFTELNCRRIAQEKQFSQLRKQVALLLTIKGEIENSLKYFELAASCFPGFARAYRDIGCYCLTEYQQTKLNLDEQKEVIEKARYNLMVAFKLDPKNIACRENLGNLLILTKTNLQTALDIFESLCHDVPSSKSYLQSAALCCYGQQNFKRSLDYYIDALKIDTTFDVTMTLQILQCLVDWNEKQKIFDVQKTFFALSKVLDVFYIYKGRNKFDSEEKKIIYIQNFLYQVNENLMKLFNWLITDIKDRGKSLQQVHQLFNNWLELVKEYAATQAGDDVLGHYIQLSKRFE